jgi:O-antigen/teichoic acid export membrane protein
LFAFNNRYIDFKPSIKLWKKEYLKEIFGLGFIFFVIQISGIVLYTTDNFIISKLFSPKEVVPYTIAFKYISISSMLFSIIATPYWSSINEAFNRKDFEWIKKAMKNLKKMSFIFVFLIFFMVIISKLVYQFWIGTKISIPSSLTIFMALFIVSSIIVTPYTIFLNGTGKIKIQAIQSVIAALINIPLSIFFAKTLNIGVNGIILATIVCFIPSLIFSQIQYSKIINNKAFGIWNK